MIKNNKLDTTKILYIDENTRQYDKYLIFNDGRIYSLLRNKFLKEFLIKGYLNVTWCINNIPKIYKIHQLVAQCFIPNPNNFSCVNHLDLDKTNNHYQNLEWCDHHRNNTHWRKYKPAPIHKGFICFWNGEYYSSIRAAMKHSNNQLRRSNYQKYIKTGELILINNGII